MIGMRTSDMIRALLKRDISAESILTELETKKSFTVITRRFVDVKIPVLNMFGCQKLPHGTSPGSFHGLLHPSAKATILSFAEFYIRI